MTEPTEHAEARRLITEALGTGGGYERQVVDLVFAATAAFGAGEKDAAEDMLAEHVNGAEDPDLAAYHVCVAAALAAGRLLNGSLVGDVTLDDAADRGSLSSLALLMINSASVEDRLMMALIMEVVWRGSYDNVHHLAGLLLELRAEVITLAEGGDRDA